MFNQLINKIVMSKLNAKIFGDITSFCSWLNSLPKRAAWGDESSRRMADEDSWYGTGTWEQAEQLLYHGDRATAQLISSFTKKLISNFCSSYSRTLRSSVVGFMPHVPNYIAGVPQSMIAQRRITQKTPVVSIYYNRSVNGNVSSADLARVSALLLAAIVQLERTRTRVNLNVCDITADTNSTYSSRRRIYAWSFKLKDASKPLDVVRCAYPLANTAMERRHFFACMERDADVPTSFSGGYGFACTDAAANEEFLKQAKDVNGIVIDYYKISSCQTVDDVIAVINRLIEKRKK